MSSPADATDATSRTSSAEAVSPVAAAAARLAEIEALPLDQHADVYQDVHAALQAALAEIKT